MHKARNPRDGVHLKLRIDERLRRQLAEAARWSVHSLNGETVCRLRSSFRNDGWQDWPASNERAS